MSKKFVLFMVFICMLLLLVPVNVVVADISDVLVSDFDDIGSGLDAATSGLFNFENIGTANYFESSTGGYFSSPNGLKCYNANDNGLNGWLNLTYSFDYIGFFNFSVKNTADWTGEPDYFVMDFYNGTTVAIRLRFHATNGFEWYDDVGWDTICAFGTSKHIHVNVSHRNTNSFTVNVTGDYSAEEVIASMTSDYWTVFDSVHIYGGSGTFTVYFDDFWINIEEGVAGCYNVDWSMVRQDGVVGIRNVTIGDRVSYLVYVNGDRYSDVYMSIFDSSYVPFFRKYLGQIGRNGFAYFNVSIDYDEVIYSNGEYIFHLQDFDPLVGGPSVCSTWYVLESFYVIDPMSTVYYDLYYNSSYEGLFAEWQHLRYEDFALVGDPVNIVYFMPSNSSATTINEEFYYCIVLSHDGRYEDHFFVQRNLLNMTVLDSFNFGNFRNVGTYYLDVYNCSGFAKKYYNCSWEVAVMSGVWCYQSKPLKVDTDRNRNNIPDTDEFVDSDDDVEFYEMIAGFGIIFGFGVVPVFLFRDNSFAIQNGIYIMLLFALIGCIIVGYYNLVPIVYVYIIALVCVAGIGLKLYSFVR